MAWAWIEGNVIFVAYSKDVVPQNVEVLEVDDGVTPQDLVVENGALRLKTEAEKLEEAKQQKIQELTSQTRSYIERHYSDIKQRSDIADKEMYEAVLAMNNIDTQQFRSDIASIVLQHYNDFQRGLQELLSKYNNPSLNHTLEQLLKVAYRVYFVNLVKQEYHSLKQAIENATSLEELNQIKIEFTTIYPC